MFTQMWVENGVIMMFVSILPRAELEPTDHRETHPTLGLYQDQRPIFISNMYKLSKFKTRCLE